MNAPRFDRFAQPDYLQRIGRERVTGMLLPFAVELLELGLALPAAALTDDLFFQVLATLPQRVAVVSAKLLEAMIAIEVLDQVFPDEVPAARGPLVVKELRFRLRSSARPICLQATADDGTPLDGSIELVAATSDQESMPPQALLAELREQRAMLSKLNAQIGTIAKELPVRTEPVTDDEAGRLFALLRALELATNFRKAPVTRVFMLYCLDAKSREEVARECHCSPALITLRLRAIEKKLGRKPAALRQISDQFERMAESLSDSRARRIHRQRAMDAPEEDEH